MTQTSNCDKSPSGKHHQVIERTGNGTANGVCKYCLETVQIYGGDETFAEPMKLDWRTNYKLPKY